LKSDSKTRKKKQHWTSFFFLFIYFLVHQLSSYLWKLGQPFSFSINGLTKRWT